MGYGRGGWGGYLAVTDYHTVGENVIHDCNFKAILLLISILLLSICH